MVNLLYSIFLVLMWVGYLWTLFYLIKSNVTQLGWVGAESLDNQKFTQTFTFYKLRSLLLCLFLPFYIFYFIYHLPETKTKKYLGVLTIGCFWLVLFLGILKIVFTPPV